MLQSGTPALLLAPMEGVTDAPMRALLSERGGFSFCVSEFLRVSQDVPQARAVLKHVPELTRQCQTPAGVPVQVQLLGGDAEKLAQTALVAVSAGATAIDLNFGCPARTVNRHDGGAALLRFPQRIRAITQAVRDALPAAIPLSAKLRLGWDDPRAIHENADMAAQGGISWLTIHGRTRAQGYKPPAYWGPIGEVHRRLKIPVVANGEIWTLDDLRRCRDQTHCEHFMIGRGALADPTVPQRLAAELGLSTRSAEESVHALDWLGLIERFCAYAALFSDRPIYVLGRIKQWAKMSHQRFPNTWYERIKTLDSNEAIFAALARR